MFFNITSGVGLMEICAMDMKLRGMYMARQLSFKDTTFENREVAVSQEFKQIYDESVELVIMLIFQLKICIYLSVFLLFLVGRNKKTFFRCGALIHPTRTTIELYVDAVLERSSAFLQMPLHCSKGRWMHFYCKRSTERWKLRCYRPAINRRSANTFGAWTRYQYQQLYFNCQVSNAIKINLT